MAIFSENIFIVQIAGTIAILITGTIGASVAPIIDAIHRYRKRKKGDLNGSEIENGIELTGQRPPLTGLDYYMPLITLILKTLGTGVVLSTALMHVLPEGISMVAEGNIDIKDTDTHEEGFYINATEICGSNPGKCYVQPNDTKVDDDHDDHGFPYGMLFASIVILLTFVLEVEMHSLVGKARDATMMVYMTEVGMVLHSLLIGVAFAVISDVDSLNTLAIALCVHQLCEGLAMGPLIHAGAKTTMHAIFLIFLFSASVPIGIAIGAIIKNNGGYSRGRTANLVEGTFECIAGGLLVYISTVEFLAELMTLLTGHGCAHGHGGHIHKCENQQTLQISSTVDNAESKVEGQEEVKTLVSDVKITLDGHGDHDSNVHTVDDEGKREICSQTNDVAQDVSAVTPDEDYTKRYPLLTRIICHVSLFFGFATMAIVALWS